MEDFVWTVSNGWYGMSFGPFMADETDASPDASPATTTTDACDIGCGRPTPRQPTGGAETAASDDYPLKSIMPTRTTVLTAKATFDNTSAAPAIEAPGTVGEPAQGLLAYRSYLDQMDQSPTRVKIRGRLEQQIEAAMEGTWANDLKLKWTERRS